MKKLLLVFTLLSSLVAFSQAQIVLAPNSSYGSITGMAIKNNYLYFGSFNVDGIKRIDLNGPPVQTPVTIVSGITGVMDLEFNGNELYICQFNGGTIKKIDVSLQNPVLVNIISGLSAPSSVQFYNNYLYIAEGYNYYISRINLNETNPVKEVVVAANGPWKIQVYGDELFVAEAVGNKISKFNLLDSNPTLVPVIPLANYPFCMYVKDSFLYYNHSVSNQKKLSKIDLSTPNSFPEELNLIGWDQTTLQSGSELRFIINNNFIYRNGYERIEKFNLNSLSNSGELVYEDQFHFYPNPANNQITFNESVKSVVVYTLEGKSIPTQLENNAVDVSHLSSGMYIVQITDDNDSRMTQKLIKE